MPGGDAIWLRNHLTRYDAARRARVLVAVFGQLQFALLTVGVGIAQTKTLAKLANHAAKKLTHTGGVVNLSNQRRQRKLMAQVPVEDVWGISKLEAMSIKTALDLCDTDIRFVHKHFSVVLERTVRDLHGESCPGLEEFAPAKQEIVCSRSFGERVSDYQRMREAVCSYAAPAAEKLRSEHQYCRYISTFIKTSPYAADPFYGNSIGTPTQDTGDIINTALRYFKHIWRDGFRHQKAGVMLGGFFSQGVAQSVRR